MLGKQMALNLMSNASQQLLPVIKVTNLFDGDPTTNLFTPHKDFGITKMEQQSDINNFVRRIVGTKNPSMNPFTDTSLNSDYLNNTGKGQLVFLLDLLNKNVYKSNDDTLKEIGIEINDPIQPRSNLIAKGKTKWFNFDSEIEYPYSRVYPKPSSVINANYRMVEAYNSPVDANKDGKGNQEYAPNQEFIENLGQPQKYSNTKRDLTSTDDRNMWIGDKTEFVGEKEQKIIWGWDGIDGVTDGILQPSRGDFSLPDAVSKGDFRTTYNVKNGGLLEYTRNLVRATEGQIGDITRKAFKKGDEIIGFNGAGLWQSNDSNYLKNSTFGNKTNKTGIRQHTALDQYDRFAKAIRFDGNIVIWR